ncbi:MAG: hypothetical protein V4721_16465 [Bacteroidota bacterium]
MGNVILDLNSKKTEVVEVKLNTPYPVLDLIVFEGEAEYKKATKPTDILGGNFLAMFSSAESCFLRDTLFIMKQRNPLAMFFILRKKGS